ncbi:uncharacterized protein [Elaeis guineensis]|uniref:uncharacterized protein n=1 Tax=Elaeis guineensis var. tenera TaxID=51953 RepID=UPI003C6D24C7
MANSSVANGLSSLSLPILDGKNYNRWSIQMQMLFDYQDIFNIVKNGVPKVGGQITKAQHRDAKKKDHKGIKHEITIQYTPQHNGVIEKRNRTIVDLARSELRTKLDDRNEKAAFISYKPRKFEYGEGTRSKNDEPISIQKPRGAQQPPSRLQNFKVISDNNIDDDGELVHYAMFADCDPLRFNEAMQDDRWINAVEEEIKTIEKSNTWQLIDILAGKKAMK